MKKIIALVIGMMVGATALCQTRAEVILEPSRPFVEGLTGAIYNQKITIQVKDNTYYKYTVEAPTDTVRHFTPLDGKRYEAMIVFTEIRDEPTIDTVEVDNSSYSFSPSNVTSINSVNAQGWSQFDSDIAPYPNWSQKFLQGSCSFSDLTGATITYTFVGKRIEIWGEKGNNKGIAGFKLDNIAEQIKDLYTPVPTADVPKEIIFEADFAQGTHQITIRVTGNKAAASTGKFVLVDNLTIYSER